MSVSFLPGCRYGMLMEIPGPVAGWDSCYLNYTVSLPSCTIVFNNYLVPCKCDAFDSCSEMPIGHLIGTGQNLTCNGLPTLIKNDAFVNCSEVPENDSLVPGQNLTCRRDPMSFTNDPLTSSGSCTYQKAMLATSAGSPLTKSNLLIAAGLVLCTVIGSF